MNGKIQQAWLDYKHACWPNELISTTQHRETRQAFFSGALIMHQEMMECISGDDDEKSAAAMTQLMTDLQKEIEKLMVEAKERMRNRNL